MRRKTINNYAITDVETTGAVNDTKGNPFCINNNLVLAGMLYSGKYTYADRNDVHLWAFRKDCTYVGANIKFDLHWFRRMGVAPPSRIWDISYAQFVIWRMKKPYVSLNDCLLEFGYPPKLDVVKTEYWEKGIDTDQVPLEILKEYLEGDLTKTEQVYLAQLNYLADKPQLLKLIKLGMEDILFTAEMEWNGLRYNLEASLHEGRKSEQKITEIDADLNARVGTNVPINWDSNDHCSAALFGGIYKEDYREVYYQTLVSGEIKRKERWAVREVQLPALVEPLKEHALKKEGYYATNVDALTKAYKRANKKTKEIINLLLTRAKIEKLKSSYLEGIPKLYNAMGWVNGYIHGQFNHMVAATGRLASAKPNQQNIPEEARGYLESRF